MDKLSNELGSQASHKYTREQQSHLEGELQWYCIGNMSNNERVRVGIISTL